MKTYIALLRGINVSGQKIIKMAELASHFEHWGFQSVRTYIQSGNVIFSCNEGNKNDLALSIAKKIKAQYGFEVAVTVKEREDLVWVLENNPFRDSPGKDPSRTYFTFLFSPPGRHLVEKLQEYDFSPGEYLLIKDTIYFFAPHGYGKAKMNNNFFEKKLKVDATTRNLKTLIKLVEMAER